MNSPESRSANVIGTGLIGASVGLALRSAGWCVSATDSDSAVQAEAVRIGAADSEGLVAEADLTVIAAPVGSIAELAETALAETTGAVTDVGSAKRSICESLDNPRFVGGHPMAGSEQDGISGARADLFSGAMWVLTPQTTTSDDAFASVRSMVRTVGAESISLPAATHDELVAQVSHVPHLASAAMMNLADSGAVEHRALLRLAAGGFRDMTRISAGRPSIWPDICAANDVAIAVGLDRLIGELEVMKKLVVAKDRHGILSVLDNARTARQNLPVGYGKVDEVSEVSVPIPDNPGEIAAITTLAAELDVNILDLGISHSAEGRQGVMKLIVDRAMAERFVGGLMTKKYRPTIREIEI